MTDAKILAMEKRLGDMRGRTARFSQTLARTRASADQLFDLLSRRARDNGNEKWREQLLNDIARKKSEFNLKMDLAGNGLLRLESSIKKYDDILGFLQVNRGLEGVNRYMAEVDQTVAQSIALNNEIQNAIQEGLKLVDPKQFQR
jgi:hypothetical protein